MGQRVDERPRRAGEADRAWLEARVSEDFGMPAVVRDGVWLRLEECESLLLAEGYAAFLDHGDWLEVAMMAARPEGRGIGSRLLAAVCDEAAARGRRGVRISTSNDNLRALGVYQRAGFRLAELRAGAIARARAIKPSIPEVAANGIAIRDEIELVWEAEPA